MSYQTRNLTRLREYVLTTAFAIVALVVVLMIQSAPTANAQDVRPPLGDCFGGALSEDPLHCYVLEEAHQEGVIDVDAVYRAGGALFIYLTQTDPVGDEVYDYILGKAKEGARRTGEYQCVLELNGCGDGVFETGRGFILPPPKVYENIRLKPGGADARRSEPGWASYRQVWPVAGSGSTDQGVPGDFDVSDVDTTNFPPFDCEKEATSHAAWGCTYSGLGIAGWHGGGDRSYVEVKIPPGQEVEVAAVAVREELYRRNRKLNEDNVVIIPVKYDFEELWRWQLVLDRFAASSGNTIGIVQAEVGLNKGAYRGGVVYPLTSVPQARKDHSTGFLDKATLRHTVRVYTLDLEKTVDALPKLLPQLNIPVDAVGLVAQVDVTPSGRLTPGVLKLPQSMGGTAGSPTVTDAGSNTSVIVAVGGAAALSALAVAGLALLFVRKLRSSNRYNAER